MLTRLVTGLTLAPLIVWLVLAGPAWGIALFLVAAGVLSLTELLAMSLQGRRPEQAVGVLTGAGLLLTFAYGGVAAASIAAAAALAIPGLLILARPEPLSGAGTRMLALYGSLVFIVGTFTFVLQLGRTPAHLMIAFAVVWLGDSGAYFVGRAIGRHKLYELISPKKTIEGGIGGLIASVGGALLMRWWLAPELDLAVIIAVGVVGGVTAQIGDLVESAFKRAYGVKDSGRLLPGHGGVLDRLDGFLFAAPVIAALLAAS